jgi:hypothetical protein
MIVCTMTALIDLLPLLYCRCSAAITSHHRDGNRSAQLVLVPVPHTCASAAATSPLEHAYRRYGVRLLHNWASGIAGLDARARAILHASKKELNDGRWQIVQVDWRQALEQMLNDC